METTGVTEKAEAPPHDGVAKVHAVFCEIRDGVTNTQKSLSEISAQMASRADEGAALDQQLAAMEERLKAIGRHLEGVQQASQEAWARAFKQMVTIQGILENLCRNQACLEQLSKERQALTEECLKNYFVEPMGRNLFPVIDLLGDVIAGPQPAGDGLQAELLLNIRAQVFDCLAVHGIEPIIVTAGAVFDPKIMTPIKRIPALEPAQHMKVVMAHRCGFRRGERMLRFVSVTISRFEACASSELRADN